MTPKELGELGHLARAAPRVDPADLPPLETDAALEPGQRKSVTHLRSFAERSDAKPITIDFDFFAMPVAIEGDGKVERVIVERTAIDADGPRDRHRRDLCHPRGAGGQLHRLSHPADRGRALRRQARPLRQ